MKLKTESDKKTKEFAEKLIKEKLKERNDNIIIALSGDLGAGKTTFIKGLSDALKVKTHVTSPTFLIIQKYPLEIEGFNNLFHIDAYRLEHPKEILNLGLKDIMNTKGNIVVIEWADKIKSIIPDRATWIKFSHGENKNERLIETINGEE